MKASIRWVQDVMFIAESESGHAVVVDGPAASGGRNVGVRPMEMMLMGMGGCTSFDVMSMLTKARQQVTDCVAELSAERAEEAPSVFTRIHIHFVVTGRQLKESQVNRAIALSADHSCSASILITRPAV